MPALNEDSLNLLQKSCGGVPTTTDFVVKSGGNLVCGAYQYSYRLYNEETRQYSRWSVLSTPISVFKSNITSTSALQKKNSANIGEISECYVEADLKILDTIYQQYTHIQVATVEHLGNLGRNNPTTAGLIIFEELPVATPDARGITTYTFKHKNNTVKERFDINDIIIPLSNVKSCEALNIKDNRLFLGNVKYVDVNTNVNPTVNSGGMILRAPVLGAYSDNETNHYKGYFPDVYRFAISYFDENGNFSQPKVLDLSNVSSNDATGIIDYKFPNSSRVSSGNLTKQGLQLKIDNHPSWAKGAIILRAKRIKDFLFETPLIPFVEIEGSPIKGSYPDIIKTRANQKTVDKTLADAQPMNPVGTFVPSNEMKPFTRSFGSSLRPAFKRSRTSLGQLSKGELTYKTDVQPRIYGGIVPQMYNDEVELTDRFDFIGSETMTVSDYLYFSRYVEASAESLESIDGVSSPVFAAGRIKDTAAAVTYVPNRIVASGLLLEATQAIKGFTELTNQGEGSLLGGKPIGQYQNLLVEGAGWSDLPSNNRMGVFQFETSPVSTNFSSGITGFTSTVSEEIQTLKGLTGDVLNRQSGNRNVFAIGQVRKGLSDDRYGDEDEQHEFIYTGTSVIFGGGITTDSEVTFDIWGGDCVHSLHDFVFSTSCFTFPALAKVNEDPGNDAVGEARATDRFNGYFTIINGNPMTIPIPMKKFTQSICVPLRSEVNGEVVVNSVGDSTKPESAKNISTFHSGVANRVTLNGGDTFTYLTSPAACKEGDAQVFFPRPKFSIDNNILESRVLYSDLKLYQTLDDSFAKFRVLNTYDLDESRGGIKSLQVLGDRMYSFQERGIVYLPIDTSQISTSDGSLLSIRSGEVIGRPITQSTKYGISSLDNIINIQDAIIFADFRNKDIILMADGFKSLSANGISSYVEDNLSKTSSFAYDFVNKELYFKPSRDIDDVYVYTSFLGKWKTTLPVPADLDILAGVTAESEFYLAGSDGIYRQFDNSSFTFLNTPFTPFLTFVVNPDVEFGKVFDNVILQSNVPVSDITFNVTGQGTVVTNVGTDDFKLREGYYIAPLLRTASKRRVRGRYSSVDIELPSDIVLKSIMTKYRISNRAI